MKKVKKYSDCKTVDDFIEYYHTATDSELRSRLHGLGGRYKHLDKTKSNERDAIVTLLA